MLMRENRPENAVVSRAGDSSPSLLDGLGPVTAFEASCVVPADDSEVVRHAAPLTEQARHQLREQAIARMQRDDVAVAARERRMAIEQAPAGKVVQWRAR